MQQELDAAGTPSSIHILGVNGIGQESGNALTCAGRSLSWLQDTPAETVWDRWRVNYRDVVILDTDNSVLSAYNLTQHDLADPVNYAALRQLLLAAAE